MIYGVVYILYGFIIFKINLTGKQASQVSVHSRELKKRDAYSFFLKLNMF